MVKFRKKDIANPEELGPNSKALLANFGDKFKGKIGPNSKGYGQI